VKSETTNKFWKYYNTLPEEIRKKAKRAYSYFELDPWHPSLHFKRIHSSLPIYSVRISKDYRAVGLLKKDIVIWFWIGSHSDYNKLLNEM